MTRWGAVELDLTTDWCDITDDLEGGAPPTLAKPDGVGALQFSIAAYRSGERPNAKAEDLLELLDGFASTRGLTRPFDRISREAPPLVGASYHSGTDFLRVWYLGNGLDFAFVTYTCDWTDRRSEAKEVEEIVHSVRLPLRSRVKKHSARTRGASKTGRRKQRRR